MLPFLIPREVHIVAAAVLVGSVVFNYFFLKPALGRIPPAPAAILSQRVGTLFTIVGLTCLGLLVVSGVVRLMVTGQFGPLFQGSFYGTPYGRWLAIKLFSWFIVLASSMTMTFLLRPRLMKKLTLETNPTADDVQKRRNLQQNSSQWLDRLQLVNVIGASLAAIIGASLIVGGFL